MSILYTNMESGHYDFSEDLPIKSRGAYDFSSDMIEDLNQTSEVGPLEARMNSKN